MTMWHQELMANEIYTMTHDGLTTMVSARVATHILDNALSSQGYSADTVNRAAMKQLLMGPVATELVRNLPRSGVERNLKQIYAQLPKSVVDPPVEEQSAPVEVIQEADSVVADSAAVDGTAADGTGAVSAAEPNAAMAAVLPVSAPNPGLNTVETVPARPRRSLYIEDEIELERVMLEFARLDHVKIVAGLTLSGEVVMSRGSGVDVAAVARFGAVGLKLLSRNGTIRSYYLAHSESQLFLFPLGAYAITVIGTVDLNLGEVFSTLSTLEEDV